jgi:AraC-like DNA-binding protein
MIDTGHGIAYAIASSDVPDDLAPFVTSFHSYHVRIDAGVAHEEVFLPALAAIRLQTYGDGWGMQIGKVNFDPLPEIALFGPTARSGRARVTSGQTLGIYLRPAGWARLIGKPAGALADQVCDLTNLWGDEARAMLASVAALDGFEDQIAALSAALRRQIAASRSLPVEAELAAIETLLMDPACDTVDQALERLNMPDWRFARLAKRHFGFTPKVLMRRARFMRTILKIREQGETPWSRLVDEAYVDQSHFIRDCHDFLAMTPVQFANRFQPIARAAFDAREEAMGDAHHLVRGDG